MFFWGLPVTLVLELSMEGESLPATNTKTYLNTQQINNPINCPTTYPTQPQFQGKPQTTILSPISKPKPTPKTSNSHELEVLVELWREHLSAEHHIGHGTFQGHVKTHHALHRDRLKTGFHQGVVHLLGECHHLGGSSFLASPSASVAFFC